MVGDELWMVAQIHVRNDNEVASGMVHPVNVGCKGSVAPHLLIRWLILWTLQQAL